FTYAPVPAITKISPAAGPVTGGTTITITGTGLSRASKVTFGTSRASHFAVISSTKITARAPAHAAGTVNIKVTTPGGTTPAVTASKYTYTPAPALGTTTPAAYSAAASLGRTSAIRHLASPLRRSAA